jgi:hypothetical protein
MRLRAFLIGTLTALAVTSCGGGGGNMAGGIGGTGVSYGPVTGFGSVIVNGVEYQTGSADFSVEGSPVGTGATGQNQLAVGMVVSVTHDDNGNAKSVSYKDDAEGPISNLNAAGNSFDVLGVSVTVDTLTVYDGISTDVNSDGIFDINDLADNDIVEVSGQITADNTVLATRVELKPTASCADGIEVKGTVSNVNTIADTFDIGTLTVNANGNMPAGLANGDYVEVQSATCPSGSTLTATSIEAKTEGPDTSNLDSADGDMEIKGTIADFVASPCTFTVNGQSVSASDGMCTGLADGNLVEVKGSLLSGVLIASEISNEDVNESGVTELKGIVTAVSPTAGSAFEGSITLGASGTFTTDVNTRFESDTPPFNLNTITITPATCVEIKTNSSNVVLSIEKKTSDCP